MSYLVRRAGAYPFTPEEYPTMLDAMRDNRIFEIRPESAGYPAGTIVVGECCDSCFGVEVTPDQLRALGQELIDFANQQELRRTDRGTIDEAY